MVLRVAFMIVLRLVCIRAPPQCRGFGAQMPCPASGEPHRAPVLASGCRGVGTQELEHKCLRMHIYIYI